MIAFLYWGIDPMIALHSIQHTTGLAHKKAGKPILISAQTFGAYYTETSAPKSLNIPMMIIGKRWKQKFMNLIMLTSPMKIIQ